MKVSASIILFGVFSVLLLSPGEILADHVQPAGPHEVYSSCHSCHIDSCAGVYHLVPIDCDFQLCWSGYICEEGYIRESRDGRCILPSECPQRGKR